MKTRILLLALVLTGISGFSQITFDKGYFIDEQGRRNECLIKNVAWKNNPYKFKYKLSESAPEQVASIDSIQEFGIGSQVKFERYRVQIDRSSDDLYHLSNSPHPQFNEEQLFLKLLIEGHASLYSYHNKSQDRYFYKVGDGPVKQLVYKQYNPSGNRIRENNMYKQQLLNELTCESIPSGYVMNLRYHQKELTRYLIKYNTCKDTEFTQYKEQTDYKLFHFTVRPGISANSLNIYYIDSQQLYHIDFGLVPGFRIGLETQVVLPVHRNKWSILFEPAFHYYKTRYTEYYENISAVKRKYTVFYKCIEIPVGLRHYFYLNDNFSFFLNTTFEFYMSEKAKINFFDYKGLDINPASNLAAGFGFDIFKKFNAELRYAFKREILSSPENLLNWTSDYSNWSLMVGYTLF